MFIAGLFTGVLITVLLLFLLYYVETSSGKRVIHKKVGDTVELSSGLPTEGVTVATWRYGGINVADKDLGVFENSPFKDRSELNPENFTLTVRKLTLQDSGDFMFISGVNKKQRPSVTITLQVHEPITKQPVIKINSTWISSNESCKVLLECSTAGDVSYKWTVGNQTLTGPRQQYIIREQDGETNVTCTVSNHVSEKSAFQTVKCSKDHSHRKETVNKETLVSLLLVTFFSRVVVLCVILPVSVHSKVTSSTMQPCSVYETIDNRPQTVYDKIQLNRVRKVSVSPYQDVS
ncbi:ribonuclease P protein subunit POP4 [Sarotherodon galilaeus]